MLALAKVSAIIKSGLSFFGKSFGAAVMLEDISETQVVNPLLRERVLRNIAESKAAREASFYKIHTYVVDAINLEVGTEFNQATFWSGRGERNLAETFALNQDKLTLEMTPGGRHLDMLNLFQQYPYEQAIKPWELLSKRFAQGA